MTAPTEAERLAELLASRAAKRIDRNPDWPAGWSLRNLEQFRSDAAAILAAGYRLVGPGEVVMPREVSGDMWLAGRKEFEKQQAACAAADRYEMMSAIMDSAPKKIFAAMLAAHEKERANG